MESLLSFLKKTVCVKVMGFIFLHWFFFIVHFIHCSFRRAVVSDKDTDMRVSCSRGTLEAKPNHSADFSWSVTLRRFIFQVKCYTKHSQVWELLLSFWCWGFGTASAASTVSWIAKLVMFLSYRIGAKPWLWIIYYKTARIYQLVSISGLVQTACTTLGNS